MTDQDNKEEDKIMGFLVKLLKYVEDYFLVFLVILVISVPVVARLLPEDTDCSFALSLHIAAVVIIAAVGAWVRHISIKNNSEGEELMEEKEKLREKLMDEREKLIRDLRDARDNLQCCREEITTLNSNQNPSNHT